MRKLSLFIFIILFFIAGCSKKNEKNFEKKILDGLEVVKNNNLSNPDLKIDFILAGEIPFEGEGENPERLIKNASTALPNSKGEIFVFCGGDCTIKKFSNDGTFIKSFGRRGSGPGEIVQLHSAAIFNDTIFISDTNTRKLHKFDSEGNYAGSLQLDFRTPKFLKSYGADKIIGTNIIFGQNNEGTTIGTETNVYDHNLKELIKLPGKTIKINPQQMNVDPTDYLYHYAAIGENFYRAEISEDFYLIDIYDQTGKIIRKISKNYRKIPMSSTEAKEISKYVQIGQAENKAKTFYKKAINGLWSDKYNRLWVLSAKELKDEESGTLYFDIFTKDGIWQNTIKLPVYQSNDPFQLLWNFHFIGDYLIIVDRTQEKVVYYHY